MAYRQPPHLTVFTRWFDRLIHTLNVRDMSAKLVSTNCITFRDYEHIQIRHDKLGQIAATETLMSGSLMRNPDPECFKSFIEALMSTNQMHLAELMEDDYRKFLEYEISRAEIDRQRNIATRELVSRYEEIEAERTQLCIRTQYRYRRRQEAGSIPVQERAARPQDPPTFRPMTSQPMVSGVQDERSMRMDYTETPQVVGVGAGNASSTPSNPNSTAGLPQVATAAANLETEKELQMAIQYPPDDNLLPDANRPAPVVPCIPRSNLTIDYNDKIGCGSFGTVYSGEMNGTKVIIKEIMMTKSRNKQKDKLKPEELSKDFQVSAFIRHANVTMLMAYSLDKSSIRLVYEVINGNNMQQVIFDEDIRCEYRLDMKEKFFLTGQIVQALAFLHQCNPRVVHGDVKPGKILITRDKTVAKLCDLGISNLKSRNMLTSTGGTLLRGTLMYMAPEQLLDRSLLTTYTDVWAMAASMYEIFFEEEVWLVDRDNMLKELKKIMEGKKMPNKVENPDPRYLDLAKLIGRCLVHDQGARPMALDLFKSLRPLEIKLKQV